MKTEDLKLKVMSKSMQCEMFTGTVEEVEKHLKTYVLGGVNQFDRYVIDNLEDSPYMYTYDWGGVYQEEAPPKW